MQISQRFLKPAIGLVLAVLLALGFIPAVAWGDDAETSDKYVVTNDADGSLVGTYDVFSDATASLNPSTTEPGAYTITLLQDDLDMGLWGGVTYGYQVTLKSGDGGPYKIVCTRESNTTNSQKHFSQIAGDLILENIVLDGNGTGGGVFIMPSSPHDPTNSASLTMRSGAVIQNCKDVLNVGAAVGTIGDRATLIMEEGSAILNSSNERNGGGVSISGGNFFIMNGGTIAGNTSAQNGGGVIINGGTFTMNGGSITNNSAPNLYGGGLCIASNATFSLTGGTISGNTAKDGAGIYIDNRSGTYTLDTMVIENNNASNRGGGIFSYPQLTITDSTISGNTSATTGGGISAWAPLTVRNSTISGNATQNEGGGVWLRHYYEPDGISNFEQVTLSGNTAKWGGGIEVFAGALTITSTTISSNETTSSGAGIFTNGDLTITDSRIADNHAATVGGGIDARAAIVSIDTTEIEKNSSVQGGGGLFLRSDTDERQSTIVNSTLSDNSSENGGGIYLMNHASLATESTRFVSNTAGTDGGAIYTDDADYTDPIASTSYLKITTDPTTLFQDNHADGGLYDPPRNAQDRTNIGFLRTSLTDRGLLSLDHPLNNYDINYRNDEPAIDIFTVTYHANGGLGEDLTDEASSHVAYIVKNHTDVGMSNPGYTFTGWNTQADGSGQAYDVGTSLTLTGNQNLYAQWQKILDPVIPGEPSEPEQIVHALAKTGDGAHGLILFAGLIGAGIVAGIARKRSALGDRG